jgi:Na+-transporting NADH:ubiquinone oxidoreductase subunit F
MATFTVAFEPSDKTAKVEAGKTLLEAAEAAGVEIPSGCGGQGLCGMCRVHVLSGEAPVTEAENNHLSDAEIKEGWRLACQFQVGSDVTCAIE